MNDTYINELADMVIAKRRMSAKARKRAKTAAAGAVVAGVAGLGASTRVSRSMADGTKTTRVGVGGRRGVKVEHSHSGSKKHTNMTVGRRKSDGNPIISATRTRTKHDDGVVQHNKAVLLRGRGRNTARLGHDRLRHPDGTSETSSNAETFRDRKGVTTRRSAGAMRLAGERRTFSGSTEQDGVKTAGWSHDTNKPRGQRTQRNRNKAN